MKATAAYVYIRGEFLDETFIFQSAVKEAYSSTGCLKFQKIL